MTTIMNNIDNAFNEHLNELLSIADRNIEEDEKFNNHLTELLSIADKNIKRQYYKEYYKKNKDKIRNQQKEYYQSKKR